MPNRLDTKHGLKLITRAGDRMHGISKTLSNGMNPMKIGTD